ncbi:MAG: thiamine phosphate synthase [Robiginitomaculum sp.]|nr:thiamine phosphate synthase [Robiginitomaculum sp.]
MAWTYTGNDRLARVATRLYSRRARPCRIAPLVFMSDPKRTPDVLRVARNLPEGAALIYRHFGAGDRGAIAGELRQISFARNLQFLIGQDADLAAQIGADGVHLPERELGQGAVLRARYPAWLLTGAAHSQNAVKQCAKNGLDAAILSPIFTSASKSASQPIGTEMLADIAKATKFPIIALGGISAVTVPELDTSGAAGIAGVSMFVSSYDT